MLIKWLLSESSRTRAHISTLFRAFRLLMPLLSALSSFASTLLPLGLGFSLPRGYVRRCTFSLTSSASSWSSEGRWPWRTLRWCVPPWPGYTHFIKCTELWLPRASSFQLLREGRRGDMQTSVFLSPSGQRAEHEVARSWTERSRPRGQRSSGWEHECARVCVKRLSTDPWTLGSLGVDPRPQVCHRT